MPQPAAESRPPRILFALAHVNSGRQLELDIARGLAVFFMIAVHVLELFSNHAVRASAYGSIIEFFGTPPAAPVFMFLLGAGIVYSKKARPDILFKRGLVILFAGYLLNLLRGTLPWSVGYYLAGDESCLESALLEFISIDIFQFAGLALLFFAVVLKLGLTWKSLLAVTLVLGVLNLILLPVKTEGWLPSALAGLFWGSSKISFFPFLSWIPYPVAGYVFGQLLIRCTDKRAFYLRLFGISLVVFLLLGWVCANFNRISIGQYVRFEYLYYHHTLEGAALLLAFVGIWIGFLFVITPLFAGVLRSTVQRWSKNVSEIYFIHWVLMGNLTLLVARGSCDLAGTLILIVAITIASDLLAVCYLRLRCRPRPPAQSPGGTR